MNSLHFIRQFLKSPGTIGAIAPSSKTLAHAMVEWIDWPNALSVVEFGPGTGVFTSQIRVNIRADAKFFAIELNKAFATDLRVNFPDMQVVNVCASNIRAICYETNVDVVDAVICGLPWASFSDRLQEEILEPMIDMMRPGSQFVTFAYLQGLLLPSAFRFRKRIKHMFSEVTISPIIWNNLPPALIYRCRK